MLHNNSKIGQFYKFSSLSKINLILSASAPPSYLVVNGLLVTYTIARYGMQLVRHSLVRSGLDIACDKS